MSQVSVTVGKYIYVRTSRRLTKVEKDLLTDDLTVWHKYWTADDPLVTWDADGTGSSFTVHLHEDDRASGAASDGRGVAEDIRLYLSLNSDVMENEAWVLEVDEI